MTTPRLRIAQACDALGRDVFVRRCVALLAGASTEDVGFLVTLGGAHAVALLNDGLPAGQEYWLRVWAARGLLWAGVPDDGDAGDVLRRTLADGAWRVREMACKVIARHRLDDLLDDVAVLESVDPVKRVRDAAHRAAVSTAAGYGRSATRSRSASPVFSPTSPGLT